MLWLVVIAPSCCIKVRLSWMSQGTAREYGVPELLEMFSKVRGEELADDSLLLS